MIEWTNDRMIEWLIEWSKSTDQLSTDQKIEWSNDRKIEYRMIDISPADQPAGSVRCRLSMWWVSKFVHIVQTIALGALCAQQLGIIKSTRRWPSGCSGKDRHYIIVCYSRSAMWSDDQMINDTVLLFIIIIQPFKLVSLLLSKPHYLPQYDTRLK
jgi:hypothetical protein